MRLVLSESVMVARDQGCPVWATGLEKWENDHCVVLWLWSTEENVEKELTLSFFLPLCPFLPGLKILGRKLP